MNASKTDFAELARYLDALPSLGGWPGNDCLVMLVQHMLGAPDPSLRWKIVPLVRKALALRGNAFAQKERR